jgi:hypothetical protein
LCSPTEILFYFGVQPLHHVWVQIGQLLALEYLVGVALPDKTRQTAVALKALYDEDVIDEVCPSSAHARFWMPTHQGRWHGHNHGQVPAHAQIAQPAEACLGSVSVMSTALYKACNCHLQGCIQYWFEKEGAAKVLGVPPEAATAVRIAAKPFVDWLAEASDEEDDEDSDEE